MRIGPFRDVVEMARKHRSAVLEGIARGPNYVAGALHARPVLMVWVSQRLRAGPKDPGAVRRLSSKPPQAAHWPLRE